jgi:hypothetical protein
MLASAAMGYYNAVRYANRHQRTNLFAEHPLRNIAPVAQLDRASVFGSKQFRYYFSPKYTRNALFSGVFSRLLDCLQTGKNG